MKLSFAYFGNPVLRKKGQPITAITPAIRELVSEMRKVLLEKKGIGLAAPQVGYSLLLFITQIPILQEDESWKEGQVRVFINPKVLAVSKEVEVKAEGCLSLPGLEGKVARPTWVTVEAMDLDGKVFQETFSGIAARCFFHENDHINGVLYIDRVKGSERKELDSALREMKKKYS